MQDNNSFYICAKSGKRSREEKTRRKYKEHNVMGQKSCGEERGNGTFTHIFIQHVYLALAVCLILL